MRRWPGWRARARGARLRAQAAGWGAAAWAGLAAGRAANSKPALMSLVVALFAGLLCAGGFAVAVLLGLAEAGQPWMPERVFVFAKSAAEQGMWKWLAASLVALCAVAMAAILTAWSILGQALVAGGQASAQRAESTASQAKAFAEAQEIERVVGSAPIGKGKGRNRL